jgi:hypothetical protein
MVVFIFYGIYIDWSVSFAHLIRNQTRLFLYIFGWLLLFVEGMYRMSETYVVKSKPGTSHRKKPKSTITHKLPKGVIIGKSGAVYYDSDESDNEGSNQVHSEESAAKEYAKRGIKYPGGQKKTRRPRRQTKRRRAKK